VLAVLAVGLAACTGVADPSPEASSATSEAASLSEDSSACAETGLASADLSAWSEQVDTSEPLVAVIVSSQVSIGPSRLLYTVIDPSYDVVASPDIQTELRLFALDRDADGVAIEADGTFLDTGTGRGLYRATVEFGCAGMWGAEIIAHPADGEPSVARTLFRVDAGGSTPAIGAPAPLSDNLTATTLEGLRQISTDPDAQLDGYGTTIEQAVTSGRPSVVFFATPAFCQSGVCGPTVEMVKLVVAEYRDDVEYVTVEPYKLRQTPNGLQPDFDEQGRLQPVEAVLDYGIAVEPYLFVIDASGNVAAKFEVVVDEDELRGALEDVTRLVGDTPAPA
jgi:hypothetical protein